MSLSRCKQALSRGFSRFRYVRLRKRAFLKSRIIDSHAVLRAAYRRQAPASAGNQLRQVVRYSIRLRCNMAALHQDRGRLRNRLVESRAHGGSFTHHARANGLTGGFAGF